MQSWLTNSGVCNPGGGALCSAQAGGLKALFEFYRMCGARPKAVRGASGGDLNSPIFVQAFADDGASIVTMEELWKNVSHSKVHTWFPHVYPRTTGLVKLTPLKKLLQENLDVDKLISSGINYSVTATRYGAEPDPEVFPRDAEFFDMLIASASYPFAFRPVKIFDSYFADAGINANVPIGRLIDAGCDVIFIVRPTPKPKVSLHTRIKKKEVRMFRLLFRLLSELMQASLNAQLNEVKMINKLVDAGVITNKKKIQIIDIEPEHEPECSVMDFNKRRCGRAFDLGYKSAKAQLNAYLP